MARGPPKSACSQPIKKLANAAVNVVPSVSSPVQNVANVEASGVSSSSIPIKKETNVAAISDISNPKPIKKQARNVQPTKKVPRKKMTRQELYFDYLKTWQPLRQEIKEHDEKELFDPNETQKCKEIYRKVLSRMDITCDCGKVITGAEIGRLFGDLATVTEKAVIDVKGKKVDRTEYVKVKEEPCD